MKDEDKKYLKYALTGFASISLSILFFFLLFRLGGIRNTIHSITMTLRPVLIGAGIAYVLHPITNSMERGFQKILPGKSKRMSNGLSVALSVIFFILIVYVLIILIVPQLYRSIVSLQRTLPGQASALILQVKEMYSDNPDLVNALDQAYWAIKGVLDNLLTDYVMPNLNLIMNSVSIGVNIAKDIIIGLIAAVYLLATRRKLLRQSKMVICAVFKPKWARLIMDEFVYADKKFGGFVSGKLIDSLIIGVTCYFISLILGFPSALLISVIIGVTNIVPFFGPFIGAIPSGLLILIQEPIKALWFAIFILILQQVDGNIIGPKILGNTTGLSSFWVLFSILLFGGLFGFVGMLIAVPLFAVIYDIIRSLVWLGLKKHGYTKGFTEEKSS